MRCAITLLVTIALSFGCAHVVKVFTPSPITQPMAPVVVEEVIQFGPTLGEPQYAVSVKVVRTGNSPFCFPPDAENVYDCTFPFEWFVGNALLSNSEHGYWFLNQVDARTACDRALTFIQDSPTIDACGRALMYYRFMVNPPPPPGEEK